MKTDKLIWLNRPISTDKSCFICSNDKSNKIILQAHHWQADKGILELAICGACGSAWFMEAMERNAPYPSAEETLQDPNFILLIYHYFELVNGLDWKVFLLEKLSHQHIKTVMEVGCNVGITLDYCKTNWNLEKVIGIEPSAYGLLGKQLLDLEIYHEFLENLPEIRGTAFDLIFATEVLEHVPTPLDFIRLLRGHLKPQGILLLTTPRSGFLEPSAPTGELYAALSPGSHYFLLSENKLRELAFEAGFQFVHIEPFGMTHVAILANTEIRLSNPGNTEIKLLDYYQKKQENLPTDERLKLGYYLNYAIHLSKTGHHKQLMADTVLNQSIQVMLSGKYALDLRNLHTSIERITSCISIFDLAKQMPFNLPHYLYWQAFSSKKVHQWTDQLIQQLEFARLVCLTGLKVDFQNLFVYHELLNRIDTALEHIPQTPSSMQIKKCSENIRRKIPELNQDTPKHFIRRIKERLKRYRYTW